MSSGRIQVDSNKLSLLRQELVSNPACARITRNTGLWAFLLSRLPGGDSLPEKVVSELWEAILGAIYESNWPQEVSRLVESY